MPKIGVGVYPIFIPGVRHDFADLGGGPAFDLDPDTLTPGVVATFNNSGSSGGSFTAAGSTRPTCQAGPNGHQELAFDNSDDAMNSTKLTSDAVSAAAYTILAVVKIAGIDTNTVNVFDNDAVFCGLSEFIGLHFWAAAGVNHFDGFHWDGAAKHAAVTTVADGNYVLLEQSYDGTNIHVRSGADSEATAAAGSISNVAGTLRLGQNYTVRYFNGSLVRMLTWKTYLSAADRAHARSRLAALFGVAA